MVHNLSTILNNIMKNTRKSIPNTQKIITDIELANKKSIELYKKYNSKPKFSILDGNKNVNKIVNKNGLFIIGYFCIFLASFHYFDLTKIKCPFSFSFRLL